MSRHAHGPWLRPAVDTFDGPSLACVMKTAPFTGNRRIGVPYLASREGDRDGGKRIYAGNALFRELVQHDDGTLGTKFSPEMTPGRDAEVIAVAGRGLTGGVEITSLGADDADAEAMSAAAFHNLPRNAQIRLTIMPGPGIGEYGLGLRGTGAMESAYYFRLPDQNRLTLNDQAISMAGLDQPVRLR